MRYTRRRTTRSTRKVASQRAYEEDAFLSGADMVLWRLYATSYDLEQFADAVKYCDEGAKRFPENRLFIRCKLWLYTTRAVTPIPTRPGSTTRGSADSRRRASGSSHRWYRMVVAAALGRAGAMDSAESSHLEPGRT